MIYDVINITYNTDINRVTIYTAIAAAILALGVLVLCSKGIIRDPVEGKLFRWVNIGVLCYSATDAVSAIAANRHVSVPMYMLFMTLNELMLNEVLILLVVFIHYHIFRSRDGLKRGIIKMLIPVFGVMGIALFNMVTGIVFYLNNNFLWQPYVISDLCEVIRFIYILGCGYLVLRQKKKRRELHFLAGGQFIAPVAISSLFSVFYPYSTVPLGCAIGITALYAGMINEISFQDRETGYYNRFYLPYLKNSVEKGLLDLKSCMIFRLNDKQYGEAFSTALNKVLPDNCSILRFDGNTVVMMAEVSEKAALKMMEEDVEIAVLKLQEAEGLQDFSLETEIMVRKRKETAMEFYETFVQKLG